MALFSGYSVSFIRQSGDNSFREDLIKLLESLKSSKLFFLVDDILFIEAVNLNDFSKFETNKYVPSLRLGLNLKCNGPEDTTQPFPDYTSIHGEEDKITWKWNQGVHVWAYPLTVDGNLFSTKEAISMVKQPHLTRLIPLKPAFRFFPKYLSQGLG